MPKPLDLLRTARRLCEVSDDHAPSQADLGRAISTAYYALFHALAETCADLLIGPLGAPRDGMHDAWIRVYRSLDHAAAKIACLDVAKIGRLSRPIVDFAQVFARMQAERHKADYDPVAIFLRSATLKDLQDCETGISSFHKAPSEELRLLATLVLFKTRTR